MNRFRNRIEIPHRHNRVHRFRSGRIRLAENHPAQRKISAGGRIRGLPEFDHRSVPEFPGEINRIPWNALTVGHQHNPPFARGDGSEAAVRGKKSGTERGAFRTLFQSGAPALQRPAVNGELSAPAQTGCHGGKQHRMLRRNLVEQLFQHLCPLPLRHAERRIQQHHCRSPHLQRKIRQHRIRERKRKAHKRQTAKHQNQNPPQRVSLLPSRQRLPEKKQRREPLRMIRTIPQQVQNHRDRNQQHPEQIERCDKRNHPLRLPLPLLSRARSHAPKSASGERSVQSGRYSPPNAAARFDSSV